LRAARPRLLSPPCSLSNQFARFARAIGRPALPLFSAASMHCTASLPS
jgi:hypothetical protein